MISDKQINNILFAAPTNCRKAFELLIKTINENETPVVKAPVEVTKTSKRRKEKPDGQEDQDQKAD